MPKIRKQKQNRYLRRLLLGLLVLFTAMAQNVPWLPAIFGIRALPLIPLVVAIAVLEQEVPAILFGALAGLLWDISAESARGWHALYLTAAAFLCAMLMRYLLNRNFLTVTLLTTGTAALYLLGRWFFDAALPGREPVTALWQFYLPRLGYTLAFLPLCYLAVRAIVRKTGRRQAGQRIDAIELGTIRTEEISHP